MSAALFGAALALAPGVGRVRFRELLDEHDDHERAFRAAVAAAYRSELERRAADLLERTAAVESRLLVYGTPQYPSRLRDLPDAPPLLFARGSVEWLDEGGPVAAIVGTRAATAYGERVTREIAGQLARAGALVLSGMARGIDAAAHRGALGSGGRTGAVLGTGIDIAYPAAHRALHAELSSRGVVLAEQPPGEKATGGSFPERNRIIAALADLVIVIEAGAKSGALITAARALELGRTVAAVPGPIDSPQSAGSNELLRDGAQLIATPADAIALLGLTAPPRAPAAEVEGPERVVWEALGRGALDLDTLASTTALPAREIMAAVTRLELTGAVECALTGEIRRR
ncbi:MAG TPA: DNA-processing protein DprA [Gemmatimonadaceae bacterium]|nr:DNA-processing protein DprA [Gemmatimonadaceae bacterium]